MEMIQGFKPYLFPVEGVFQVEKSPAEYKLPGGWVRVEESIHIIGETEDSYVYRLQESDHGEWVGDEIVKREYILPLGVHKSRLVRWNQ